MTDIAESTMIMPPIPAVSPPLPVAMEQVAAPQRGLLSRCGSALDWLFGFAALVAALAACSVIPLLNFLSLGYLLHVSGTVARTGRLRDAFIGVRKASVVGSMVAGIWLVLWPARILSAFWRDAELIAPGSTTATLWRVGLISVTLLTFGHIAWACIRGGRLMHFLWQQIFEAKALQVLKGL